MKLCHKNIKVYLYSKCKYTLLIFIKNIYYFWFKMIYAVRARLLVEFFFEDFFDDFLGAPLTIPNLPF